MRAATLALALTACTPPPADAPAPPTPDADDTDVAGGPPTADTAEGPGHADDLTVTWGPEQTCADPSLREDAPYALQDLPIPVPPREQYWGGGASLADLDADGDLDAIVGGEGAPRLFRWTGDRFGEPELPWPPELDLSRTAGAVPVDLDADGDLDLFVLRYGAPDRALLNDGRGRFVDGTAALGLDGLAPWHSQSASFADPDLDGDLDVFVAHYVDLDTSGALLVDLEDGDPNLLLERVGDAFVDRSERLFGPASVGYTFTGGWVDLDDDGDWELYVANDFGVARGENQLLAFDAWTFTGRRSRGLDLRTHSMGLATADLNDDGRYDLLVSAWDDLHLMLSQDKLWFDAAEAYGLEDTIPEVREVAWGTAIADLDADGLDDAVVAFGFVDTDERWRTFRDQPHAWFLQQPDRTFVESSEALGTAAATTGRAVAVADVDRDGFLDVLIGTLDGVAHFYRGRCNDNRWLTVELRQPGPNPFAVGARVKLVDGGQVALRTVRAGDGLAMGGPPEVHFGTGRRDVIDKLRVRWPDGRQDVLEDVPTRRRVVVTRR